MEGSAPRPGSTAWVIVVAVLLGVLAVVVLYLL
jgi:hypothetical protein